MMDQAQNELIQAAVDDELDAAGRERVKQLLAESQEARDLHEDLQRLNAFIGQVSPVDIPSDLHARIVDGIELPKSSGLGRYFRFEALPGFLRYGLAGAAAVVLTVAVYQGGNDLDPSVATDDLLGTMAARGDMAGGREIDALQFTAGNSQGAVRLMARGDHYALVFELTLDQPTDLEVTLPEGHYRIDAFARETEDPATTVSWSDNRFNASLQGAQRFVVRLSRLPDQAGQDTGIDLRLVRDGVVLHRGALTAQSE